MPHRTLKQRDQTAELLWKWALRLTGLAAFIYVLVIKNGQVPSAIYFLIGGLIGLPNVIGWQRALRETQEEEK